MKIYLDSCCLNRPLDDRTQARVALEADAILAVISLCESGIVTLVASEVLTFELDRNPHPQRREFVSEILRLAPVRILLSDAIVQCAKSLAGDGFKELDALHLACAEAEKVDFFCTCDDRFLRRARARTDISVKSVSPLEMAQEIVI